ncbi:MAG: serine/threonine-protein phosphatase [Muribaculaceae bacterium]|nr:serine/threonine-protein phosphatase [Muribaculaceae bacterium]
MRISLYTPIAISEIGRRERQEDTLCPMVNELQASDRVFVVCDGLGGHEHGDVASATVAHALHEKMNEALSDGIIRGRDITEAVKYAHAKLNETAQRFDSTSKPMGTTMAMIVFGDNGVVAAHIGDSRIYHISRAQGKVLYRSRDHSLVNDLFQVGKLSRSEAESSPKKSMLTRAMLPAPFQEQSADMAFITNVEPGDYFFMCSDGVSGEIDDEKLLNTLCDDSKSNDDKLAQIQMLAQGGADNRTALLLQVESVHHELDEKLLNDNEKFMCDKMVFESVLPMAAAASLSQDSDIASIADADDIDLPPIPEEDALGVDESVEVELLDDDVPPITDEAPIQQKDNRKKLMWIALAALLLALGILAFFMLNKPSQTPVKKVVTDTLPDPDVTIDTILPEVPVDTFDTGSAVAVPPAPGPPAANYPSSHVDVPSNYGYNDSYYDSDDNDDDNNYNRSWRPRENDDDSYDQQPEQRQEVARPTQQQQTTRRRGLAGVAIEEMHGNKKQIPIGRANNGDVPQPSRNSGTFHTP